MQKVFNLQVKNKNIERQVDSIKNEVRKYIKREKNKKLPENFDMWKFNCKFGINKEEAKEINFFDITKSIDFASKNNYENFYLEIISFADKKKIIEKDNENEIEITQE